MPSQQLSEELRGFLSDQRWQCYEDESIYTGLQLYESETQPDLFLERARRYSVGRGILSVPVDGKMHIFWRIR